MNRSVIVSLTASALLVVLCSIVAKSGEMPMPQNMAGSLLLATNRSAYMAGDDIHIRVALRNTSSWMIRLGIGTFEEIKMSVTDAEGHTIPPTTGRRGMRTFTGGFHLIAPGTTFVWPNGADGFQRLSDFGYELKGMGTYHVVAVLNNLQSYPIPHPSDMTCGLCGGAPCFWPRTCKPYSIKSNSVTITIVR